MQLTTEEGLALQLRRRSFQSALADLRVQGASIATAQDGRPILAVCPCCGYPTLTARGDYDTCPICYWEDDGQDDVDADVVRGGPNADYSLAEARCNVVAGGTHHRPSDPRFAVEQRFAARRERVVAAYDALLPEVFPWSFIDALPRIAALRKALEDRRYGKRRMRRFRRSVIDERRRQDRVWEIWRAVSAGTLPRWHPFKPPGLQRQEAAVLHTIASRADAIVRRRLGDEAPAIVSRTAISCCWSDGERSAWLTRYEERALGLAVDPYDGSLPEATFALRDKRAPDRIAERIVRHFRPRSVTGGLSARQ